MSSTEKTRCKWCMSSDLMKAYHDEEWGVVLHDDLKLFEFMVLDAFQAGLSWSTIINKRENFRKAFDDFIPEVIATYNEAKVEELMRNAGIIRNQLKIRATIKNASLFLKVQQEYGSFDKFIWQFVGQRTIVNKFDSHSQIPAKTAESDAMSKALTKLGFKFVGSTICYAFMQAAGMVNDHTTDCFRYKEVIS